MTLAELQKQGYRVKVSHRRPLKVYVEFLLDDLFPERTPDAFEADNEFFTRWELAQLGLAKDQYGELISQTGGVTIVTIVSPQGDDVASGTAYCRLNESFNRKLGRTIATNRALKDYAENVAILDDVLHR